jgi:hypothetical protein
VFDYRIANVVETIVKAAKEDGVKVQVGFDVIGHLKPCMEMVGRRGGVSFSRSSTR